MLARYRITSFRFLVEFYQLSKGLEMDVVINRELTALVLLDTIVVHLAMVAVKNKTRILTNSTIKEHRLLEAILTRVTVSTCYPLR